jgi:ketosteroid isomerase-like protein
MNQRPWVWGLAIGSFILIVAVASCVSSPETSDAEFEEAARAIFINWEKTSLNPDLDSWIAMWDEDAVKMATGKPTVYGKEAILAYRTGVDEKVTFEKFDISIEEVQPAGRYGWVQGRYNIVAIPKKGGDKKVSTGTYLTIFKKQPDGSWKIYRDTMMSDPK